MNTFTPKELNHLLIILIVISLVSGILLAHANVQLEKCHKTKEQMRKEIYAELDSMAWTLNVDANRRYVKDQTRVFRCSVIKEEISKQNYYVNRRK